MTFLAAGLGYLIGSVPTSVWLGRLWGVDLRSSGSGNPGANNARKVAGYPLALLVLAVEMAKGLVAVALGLAIGDEAGAVAAGLGAITGNVYNVWFRFGGGKGLGITAGVLIGMWPFAFPIAAGVIVVASWLTGSSGLGALITMVALLVTALVWERAGWENAWGVDDPRLLLIAAIGILLILVWKHSRDALDKIRSRARP
jgi:glycerol-3-phosphate acyltransferase PlsY